MPARTAEAQLLRWTRGRFGAFNDIFTLSFFTDYASPLVIIILQVRRGEIRKACPVI